MTDEYEVLLGLINGKSKVTRWLGDYRGIQGDRLLVDVGESRIPCASFSPYLPELNEVVWVFFFDETPFLMGPAAIKPGSGVVLSVTSEDTVIVETAAGNIVARYAEGADIDEGEHVRIVWADGAYALPYAGGEPAPPVIPGAPGGGSTVHSLEFPATDSGQYRTRWQGNDPWASDSVSGAWFYGGQNIPANAGNVQAWIFLPLLRQAGVCRIGRHTAQWGVIPAGAGWPGSTDETDLSPRLDWVPLPAPIVAGLVSQGGGITVTSGNGDTLWAGTQKDSSMSGRLRFTYTL